MGKVYPTYRLTWTREDGFKGSIVFVADAETLIGVETFKDYLCTKNCKDIAVQEVMKGEGRK